ncbi:MAG: T9SS type A sorting domain-containing protein [bacterium]|nr:T9SS type A sorting domain-containing protein [bacterium]
MNTAKVRTFAWRVGHVLLLLGFLTLSVSAMASEIPVDDKGLPLWEERIFSDFPVRIQLSDARGLDILLARVPIASFNREQVTVVGDTPFSGHIVFSPRVTTEELMALERAGFICERLVDYEMQGRKAAESAWASQYSRGGDAAVFGEKGEWHNNSQIGAILDQTETDHPALARTFNWGTSVDGRPLHGIVISANVNTNEVEPEVRLSSTMHGDEVVGIEMYLYFVELLTDHYGEAGYEDVTYLVDNYEIHFMPLHNPDGNSAHQRSNSNGVDLNRNFPEPDGTHPTQEIENIHFMSYANSHHFVISANSHTGALVVNYPWDYTYDRAPDDAAIILMSLEYSYYNSPMYNGSFTNGITHGADWYMVQGSVQDWSYYVTGCIDVTLELNDVKWPDASRIDPLWEDNRESLKHFVKCARYGVHGVVTSAESGLPLDATITVAGIEDAPVKTDPQNGDYYKLLHTGSFDITYEAYGYLPTTIYGVSSTWGTETVQDVALTPEPSGLVSGTVTAGGQPLNATIVISTSPAGNYVTTAYSTAGAGGLYEVDLPYGEYLFDVACTGYSSDEAVVIVNSDNHEQNFTLFATTEVVLFSDDMESGPGNWTGSWDVSDEEAQSPTMSLTDSPGTDYANNESSACEMAAAVSLVGLTDPELSFWAQWEIEDSWDCVRLQITTDDGGSWTDLATQHTTSGSGQGTQPDGVPLFDDNQFSWVYNTVDLSPWDDEAAVRFRFLLSTDTSQKKDGFYCDDFEIKGMSTIITGVDDNPVAVTALSGNYPNPFNPTTTISFSLAADGPVRLNIYDTRGRLVRKLITDTMTSGPHSVVWNGSTESGERAGSGIYFARLSATGLDLSRKLVLVK